MKPTTAYRGLAITLLALAVVNVLLVLSLASSTRQNIRLLASVNGLLAADARLKDVASKLETADALLNLDYQSLASECQREIAEHTSPLNTTEAIAGSTQ